MTLAHGFEHFIVIDENQATSYQAYTAPGHAQTHASAYGSGNYAHGTATTTYTPGQTAVFAKPSNSNVIACFEEKPEGALAV